MSGNKDTPGIFTWIASLLVVMVVSSAFGYVSGYRSGRSDMVDNVVESGMYESGRLSAFESRFDKQVRDIRTSTMCLAAEIKTQSDAMNRCADIIAEHDSRIKKLESGE